MKTVTLMLFFLYFLTFNLGKPLDTEIEFLFLKMPETLIIIYGRINKLRYNHKYKGK